MLQNEISATNRFHASSKSLHSRSPPNIRATENKPHRYNRNTHHFVRIHIPRKAELDYAIPFWLFFDQPCVCLLQGMAAKGECGAGINISQRMRVKPILLNINIKLAASHWTPKMVRISRRYSNTVFTESELASANLMNSIWGALQSICDYLRPPSRALGTVGAEKYTHRTILPYWFQI